MRKLTFFLLCALVFAVPWEFIVKIELVGSVTRLVGAAAVSIGVLCLLLAGRFRRPSLILCLAIGFTTLNVLSLFWTIDWSASFERVVTYAQLLGLAFLICEFARTREEQQWLMTAYCLGAYLSVVDVLRSYLAGERKVASWGNRYSGLGSDPNDLGLMLALGIPMAWHLFLTRKGIIRIMAGSYVPVAFMGIMLTASRGAFLSSMIALSIVPLAWPRRSVKSTALITITLLAAAGAVFMVVPQSSWDRIMTTSTELRGGSMSGRIGIWTAGLQVFQDRMVLGVGAGAFDAAVEPLIGPRAGSHNAYLAILVEQGVIGLVAFVALLVACGWTVYRLQGLERKLWAVSGLTWLVGVMSLNWQYRKVTWVMFGLISAQAAVRAVRQQNPESADDGRGGGSRSAVKRLGARRPTAA